MFAFVLLFSLLLYAFNLLILICIDFVPIKPIFVSFFDSINSFNFQKLDKGNIMVADKETDSDFHLQHIPTHHQVFQGQCKQGHN